ncbi:2-hydroxyacyl-CoA dehydratase family protein [Paraburkholderia antibiotica]|uniref:2-hydroxyacyl-CoA dehydratase n=1 Tax=Paraburkholderia antibiotica TaxID=2728839 RepID=A0A7Y0A0Z5_9BURK|nr:2-hydroxyacyl-CoA dehydratase family protein [Paraburkholderia antibiotica]NML34483.1 2-hydroxyacyl-CoA dehydratase [Paraburkholderia antibiotica]
MSVALLQLEKHYRERDLRARTWKSNGGKVVGYFGETVPVEMIAAAGFLPYRLSGNHAAPVTHLGKHYFPYADKSVPGSRVMSLEFVNSMLDMLLSGAYDFVDYLVIPNSRKAILAIHSHLTAARAADPGLRMPELYILDRTITSSYVSSEYNRARIFEFKEQLERWSGRGLTNEALEHYIALYNENRSLLGKIDGLRTKFSPVLSGVQALHAYGAAKFIPVEEHSSLLRHVIDEAADFPPRAGARVFVTGSPLDYTDLYERIEEGGATVVSENHSWGMRCAGRTVDTDCAPMDAIADAYHKTPGCTTYPLAESVRACTERALESKSSVAVFFVYRHDDAQVFDTPDEIAALVAVGIESVYLSEQPYRFDYTQQSAEKIRNLLDDAAPSANA